MTNGNDRLDHIERILAEVAESQKELTESNKELAESSKRLTAGLEEVNRTLDRVGKRQEEMAARQQYHDEAFERADAETKALREFIMIDAENIRALARIAEHHNRRLEDLEG